jgi:20S proteasome alpha/beta subunit
MVTLGGLIEFEHEVPKVMQITDKVVALIAGDALRGSRLVREVMTQIPAGSPTVQGVADAATQRYTELRRLQIESDIFAPRGITMQDFYQGLQQRMLPQLVGGMDNHVSEFDYGVELLIAGVDDSGGRLFSLRNPGGSINDFQQIGYTGIGSGALHAVQSMIGFGHMSGRSLHESVFTVYASKRRAEVAPGVGKDTDLAIIVDAGIARLDKNMLDHLETLYQDYQRPLSQELKDEMSKLNFFEETKQDAKEEANQNADNA